MATAVSLAEVATHSTESSCWVAINGNVYDVTKFLSVHPGGAKTLLSKAGRDASKAFNVLHDASVLERLGPQFLVGKLAADDEASAASHNDELEGEIEVATQTHSKNIAAPSAMASFAHGATNYALDLADLSAKAIYYTAMAPMEWVQKTFFPVKGFGVNADGSPTKVAIIGGGCSGLSAAWCLNQTEGFDITVFEAQPRLGGHAFTFDYEAPGDKGHVQVDMGFIFGNHVSYANMMEIMEKTGSEIVDTELSLSADIEGQRWATNSDRCGPKDEVKMEPRTRAECDRFHALADRHFDNVGLNLVPFGVFLRLYGFGKEFLDLVVTPTLITLFISEDGLYGMSTRFMLNMFAGPNKFVDLRFAWKCFTVKDGTYSWIQRLAAGFQDRCRTGTPVREVRRIQEGGKDKVLLRTDSGLELYDHVVFCCSAKAAALILQEQTWLEKWIFANIRYEGEQVVLHTDPSFLPKDEGLVRNFNYKTRSGVELPELTGLLGQTSLQPEVNPTPILTMNPMRRPKGEVIHERFCGVHVQDLQHLVFTRVFLPNVQGSGNVWYGASWCNWLGHSGGIDAGLAVATRLGGVYPLSREHGTKREMFEMTCQDMFGPRFVPYQSVRKKRPIFRAAL